MESLWTVQFWVYGHDCFWIKSFLRSWFSLLCLLPYGKSWKRQWPGCDESCEMSIAVLRYCSRVGRKHNPDDHVQLLYHTQQLHIVFPEVDNKFLCFCGVKDSPCITLTAVQPHPSMPAQTPCLRWVPPPLRHLLMIFLLGCEGTQSCVEGVEERAEHTPLQQPGAEAESIEGVESQSLWDWPDRKSRIQLQVSDERPRSASLDTRRGSPKRAV